MYSRSFLEPPRKLVEGGKAHFGTYAGVSPRFDIMEGSGMPAYGARMPFISNLGETPAYVPK